MNNEQLETQLSSDQSLKNYLALVLARKWVVLSIFLLVTAAAICYVETAPPVYEAIAVLMSESNSMSTSIYESIQPYFYRGEWDLIGDHQRLMKSRNVTTEVAKRLSEEWNIDCSMSEIQGSVSLTSPQETSIIEITATSSDPDKVAALANTVAEVFIEKTSEMKNADLSRAIEFLSEQMKLVDEKLRQSEEKLNAFREKEGIIARADRSGYGRSSLLDQLGGLQDELSWTKSEKDLVQAQLESVNNLIAEKKSQLELTGEIDFLVGSVTPQIEQLQSKISGWQLELVALQETFTNKHYKVIELKQRIEQAQQRLQSDIADLVSERAIASINPISEWQSLVQQAIQLHVQLKGYEHKEKLAAAKIETFKKEHPDLLEKEVQLVRLEREARIREKTYMLLTDRYEESLLLRQVSAQDFSVVDDAIPPKYPIGPRKKMILVLSVMLGLMLGIAMALFIEYMDDSVRRGEDVEKRLGIAIVGSIPRIQTASTTLLLPEATTEIAEVDAGNQDVGSGFIPDRIDQRRARKLNRKYRKRLEALQGRLVTNIGLKSPISESYRSLWTNIQFASNMDRPAKTILVTSPGPREGKSLTAANLALTMAQAGVKVLIIDTDLRRPMVHRLFGYQKSPGLSELITSDLSNIESAIRNTYADNLYILTCGKLPPNPIELLGSEKMRQLIEEAKSIFDIILFDSPPLIAMADASVLATELDTTLLVIQAGQTKQHIATQAKELLKRLDIDIFGAVFNGIDYSRRYGYYGYHYYRQYHNYYSREEDEDIQ